MDGYNWWWKEDDNCNEGILLQLSLPGVFVLLWAQLSREASIFMMLKTDGKISNTSQKSDKKKKTKRNWATEQTDVVVFISEALFWSFSCRCSPSRRNPEVRVSLRAAGVQAAFKDSPAESVCRHPSLIYYENQDYFSLWVRLLQIRSSHRILALNWR